MRLAREVARAASLLVLGACGLTISFDGYDTNSFADVKRYKVRATVAGLEGDAQATVTVNGRGSVTVGNGTFELGEMLSDGDSYVVAASAPGHACTGATDTIRGSDVDIALSCPSVDTTLVALTVSSGAALKTFAAPFTAGATYPAAIPLFAPSASFTATARSRSAKIRIGATTSASGTPISIAALERPLAVDLYVVAASGAEAKYRVVLGASSTYVKASNTRTQALFGYSLALSGDTAGVGSRGMASST